MENKMKKSLLLAAMAVSVLCGCNRETVPAGYVGVKVDLYGDDKGVQQSVVDTGKYWLSWNEEIYQFPTFNQLHNYSDPFTFQTAESLDVNAKIGVEYQVEHSKVSTIFQTYRKGVDEITDINIRQNISDSLIDHASTMSVNQLAANKTKLMQQVTADLRAKLDPIGIHIVKLSWVGDITYPDTVRAAINAKIEATQKALLRENEVAEATAQAQKEVEKAKGDATAIQIKGDALRKNPEVLQLETISKWDGKLPMYQGGNATPLIRMQ
jgi:regulator of protease activity HflC (stomatin/prohibitin superfamily)